MLPKNKQGRKISRKKDKEHEKEIRETRNNIKKLIQDMPNYSPNGEEMISTNGGDH